MITEDTKKLFIAKYSSFGDDKFYKFLLNYAVAKIANADSEASFLSPEVELMDYHDRFLILYRRENDQAYLDIARVFRKAAHRIYRLQIKKNPTNRNGRFLNVVG